MVFSERLSFAFRRPDLALRRVRGLPASEIHLDEIKAFVPAPSVILEAGAFDGTDTIRMAQTWPNALIHSFEPFPPIFAKLEEVTQDLTNVKRWPLALSNRTGQEEMFISLRPGDGSREPSWSESSSLRSPKEHLVVSPTVEFPERLLVNTTTLDQWASESNISRVDFAWLDLQGVELDVLQASPQLLSSIKAVHMEISRKELYEGQPVYPEVIEWMRGVGFELAIDRVSVHWGNALFVR